MAQVDPNGFLLSNYDLSYFVCRENLNTDRLVEFVDESV